MEPFIHTYQLNIIRRKLNQMIHSIYFTGDNRVMEATIQVVGQTLQEMFGHVSQEHRDMFKPVTGFRGQDEVNAFLESLKPYVIPFPQVTPAEIKKLFPKVKKLTMPGWNRIDFSSSVYLGWRDISTNSLFLVYNKNGKFHGLECRYLAGHAGKTSTCFICNQAVKGSASGLVTTVLNKRGASADYYKSVGTTCA